MKREIRVTPAELMGETHRLEATLGKVAADDGTSFSPRLLNELTNGIVVPCENSKDSCAIRGGNVIWYAAGSDAGGGPPNISEMEKKVEVAEKLAARTLTTYVRLKTLLNIYDRENEGEFNEMKAGD